MGRQLIFYIRVTNIELFNVLYEYIEHNRLLDRFEAQRQGGYYVLTTFDSHFWRDLYLYGQMLAQDQDDYIEGGEKQVD